MYNGRLREAQHCIFIVLQDFWEEFFGLSESCCFFVVFFALFPGADKRQESPRTLILSLFLQSVIFSFVSALKQG